MLIVIPVMLLAGGCATSPKPFAMHEVAPGIYEGRKPWTQRGFDALRAHGVRTILNLEDMPWDVYPEMWQAHHNGLEYRNIPILAAPVAPSEKRVTEALQILADPSLRPIFVHCFLGEDRSSFIIGLYRMYFQHWTPAAAWNEMLQSDFHVAFRLRGLRRYFWRHTRIPAWAKVRSRDKPP